MLGCRYVYILVHDNTWAENYATPICQRNSNTAIVYSGMKSDLKTYLDWSSSLNSSAQIMVCDDFNILPGNVPNLWNFRCEIMCKPMGKNIKILLNFFCGQPTPSVVRVKHSFTVILQALWYGYVWVWMTWWCQRWDLFSHDEYKDPIPNFKPQ